MLLGHIYSRTYLAVVTSPVLTALGDDSREVDDELTRETDDDELAREVVNDVRLENEEFAPGVDDDDEILLFHPQAEHIEVTVV